MENIINKIYCINLDFDKERYEKVEDQFKLHNLTVERFSGIVGSTIKQEDYPNIIKKNSILLKNKCGSTGCYLSHMIIWDKILENPNIEIALILEDDIILHKNFKKKFVNNYNLTPDNWELLYLGTGKMKGTKINSNIIKPKIGNYIGYNNGTFGYMIKRSAINKIKKLILPINNKTIDNNIRSNFHKIKAYYFIDNIIKHNYNFSQTKKNFDKIIK